MIININLNKYKELVKQEIRDERIELLAKLDIEYIRALEEADSDKQAEVIALKQALRDATKDPVITEATTPQQLKEARPAILDIVKNR